MGKKDSARATSFSQSKAVSCGSGETISRTVRSRKKGIGEDTEIRAGEDCAKKEGNTREC